MTDKKEIKSETAKKEEAILKFWQENKIFEKSLAKPAPRGEFIFYEGPPTANGRPGIHHLEARAFKDAIPRYKTMQGFHVRRKAGWDTHGLPVELEVEKQLGLKSKKEIEKYGIARFNQKCKESVWKYVDEWEKFTERIGYWLDLDDVYITYEPKYIETLWWIVKQVHDRGLLYKDYKVVPWCPRCQTALSSHELAQGYEDVTDPAVYVKFPVRTDGRQNGDTTSNGAGEYFLVWTTTPWTLPGNVALAVGEEIDYVKVDIDGPAFATASAGKEKIWLAKRLLETIAPQAKILEEKKGRELVGLEYEPLFPFLGELLQGSTLNLEKGRTLGSIQKAYKVYSADFVSTEEGTGIVHTAVMYGAEDFDLGTKVGLPKHHLVDEAGKFISGTGFLAGKFVKEADKEIITDLQKRGLLFKEETITHTYPFCWRCDTALIYFARDSWYIKMSALREELIKENQGIHWEPEYIKEGRFGEWLSEVKDWAISRERYWGTPLPIWRATTPKHPMLGQLKHRVLATSGVKPGPDYIVIDSFETLKKYTKKSGSRYFAVRHGQSVNNVANIVNWRPNERFTLTSEGRKRAKQAGEKLKKENTTLIFASDLPRTRETAEIIAAQLGIDKKEIIYDERIREIKTGDFDGRPISEYRAFFTNTLEKFSKQPPGGETLTELKNRVMSFLYELESKYSGKNILIVSHEYPIWMMIAGSAGLDARQSASLRESHASDFPANGEIVKIDFVPLPHNEDYELDLHRPYIDELELVDEKGQKLRRVPEVMDVWFDSGSMPFAQDHYPFENRKWVEGKGYPADYISEAIDQTRGWFYTLHAIGVLLGRGKAYRNVISLGLLLDKNGKKMSKSLGNIVDPWQMSDKYGADALRFWMYTVNQPGESKNFDEKTVVELVQKTLNLLRNVLAFYLLYARTATPDVGACLGVRPHILDKWILSSLNKLIAEVTGHLENYKVMEAARAIREFIFDLSQWWLRRSRERFKNQDSRIKNEAAGTLRHVLLELSKLMAPFTPFVAEEIYRAVSDEKESVHLEEWSKAGAVRSDVLENTRMVREVVSQALQARSVAKIPVRQPLSTLYVLRTTFSQIGDEYLELIKAEVNVKEIKKGDELKLDTEITPELRKEGQLRELVRATQNLRKKKGLNPGDKIILTISTDKAGEALIKEFEKELKTAVSAKEIRFGPTDGEKIEMDELKFKLDLTKF